MASPENMLDNAGKKKCMTCLPQEMIELVLVRLPVSALLRCRSVCKQWYGIIRDPEFIMAHLQRASPCPLLYSRRESHSHKLYPGEAIIFDEAWSPSRCNFPVIEPDDFVCASCNGLVLLYSDKSTIKIANLATGECLHLAKPGKKLKSDHYALYTFGYHPVTKEYKVIRFHGDKQIPAASINVIQVYTLGDDNWREIKAPKARLDYIEYSGVVSVDGAIFWPTEDKESSWGRAVVSFDLNEECFESVKLPTVDLANHSLSSSDLYRITHVDGKVCVVKGQRTTHSTIGFDGKLQIWTLDNMVDQSWSQKYNIQLSSVDIYIPGPYFIHGDKILMFDSSSNLYCQELVGQNIEIDWGKITKVLNYSPCWYFNMLSYMHVNSLVQLDAYSKADVVVRRKRRDGWELKKWEFWMQELYTLEKLWYRVYNVERLVSKKARAMGIDFSLQLQHPPQKCRLNWVEQKRVKEMLIASSERLEVILEEALEQARDTTQSKRIIHKADQVEV